MTEKLATTLKAISNVATQRAHEESLHKSGEDEASKAAMIATQRELARTKHFPEMKSLMMERAKEGYRTFTYDLFAYARTGKPTYISNACADELIRLLKEEGFSAEKDFRLKRNCRVLSVVASW